LTAGNHALRINMTTAGFNINYLDVAAQTPAPGVLAFGAATYSVAENGGNATITVNRTGGSSGQVTVNYATANGTATAGSDYTSASGALTFAAGVTAQTFAVPILDDAVSEGSETISLSLSSPTGGATLGGQSTATLTIIDNDGVVEIAQGKPATASSEETYNGTLLKAGNANDGNTTTRWSSAFSDPQWIRIDLGATYSISRVTLTWEAACAKNYTIDISPNGTTWTTIATKTNMASGARTDDITGLSGSGRYIRMNGTARNTTYGYSLYEFKVYGTAAAGMAGSSAPQTTGVAEARLAACYTLALDAVTPGGIRFTLPTSGRYELALYSVKGVVIKRITAYGAAGPHMADARLPAAGVYLVRLATTGGTVERMVRILQ
jgi:hypothetical protein